MKAYNSRFRPLFYLIMAIWVVSFTAEAEEAASSKTKRITQNYNVNANDLLNVESSYGVVTIAHWDKKEAAISVEIEANGKDDRRVEEILNMVKVEIDKSGNTVRVKSSMKNMRINGRRDERLNVKISVTIPATMRLELSKKYGDIFLANDHQGSARFEVKYGNIYAGDLKADIEINAAYSNLDFGHIQNLRIDMAYCNKASFKNAETVDADMKYSNMDMRDLRSCQVENKYGNFEAGTVEAAKLEFRYGSGTIDKIKRILDISSLDYGNLFVKELSADFVTVSVEAKYGNLHLNIPKNSAFNVLAEDMKYGNLEINGFNEQRQKEGSTIRTKVNNGNENRIIYFEGNNYSNLTINPL